MNISTNLKFLLAGAVATIGLAAVANPTVSVDQVTTGDPWSTITVNYTLDGIDTSVDYKVAFDVTAQDVTKGITNAITKLANQAYAQEIDTAELFGETKTDRKAKVRVSLIAVKPAPKPENTYLIIDLTADANGKYLVTYEDMEVADANAKFNTDEYKTGKLVLRKVKAGQSYYCAPWVYDDPLAADRKKAVSRDYWIGIFEVTEAQYAKVTGGTNASVIPEHNICYQTIRGTSTETEEPTSTSFLGKLSLNCQDVDGNPVAGFDLPTENQWEIACRADTATQWCCAPSELSDYAVFGVGSWTVAAHANVGSKLPNAWGIYDMHGNVFEWCRDAYQAYAPTATPEEYRTQATGGHAQRRIMRGGAYLSDANGCRSAVVEKDSYENQPGNHVGFRLCRMAPAQ